MTPWSGWTRRVIPFAAFVLVFVGRVQADEILKFAEDRPFDIEHIKIDAFVDLPDKFVRCRATIKGVALRELEQLRLNAVGFDDVRVHTRSETGAGGNTKFENDGEHLIISPTEALAAGDRLDIFIDYTINDPKSGLHFFGPSEEEPEEPYLMWSQGQSIDNRHWVPCYDHPNERQTSEISCTVAKPYTVFSNGTLLKTIENNDDTRTFIYSQEKPHVSYLMTLVVGEFATKTDKLGDLPISYHARPVHEGKLERSFKNTPAMIEWFGEKIGVAYPWAKYDQVCCYGFGGGMENTSSTTLGERALYDERRILDDDPDGLIAHELAHQWYGDLLTCRDWAHIWLNEGFASYFEALWDEKHNGAEEFAHNMRGKARGAIEGGRDHPIVWRGYSHPDEQFDSRAYPKGAWVLHMIRRRLGDELFWTVMKAYTEKFSLKTVETVDLRKTIEEVTGRSFERFFYDWTERAGSPEVKVIYSWVADDRMAKLTVAQTQKQEPYHFPLTFEFGWGEEEKPHRVTHEVTERQSTFYIPLRESPLCVRIDPDQAVLMTLTREQPRNIWVEQLRDANPSARLDAVAHFAAEGSSSDTKLLTRRLAEDSFWAVRADIAAKLGEEGGDEAKKALLDQADAEHPRVRAAVVEALAKFKGDKKVEKVLAGIVAKGDPSYRVESAAIRGYGAVHNGDVSTVVAEALSRDSDREVIRTAALEVLGKHGDEGAYEQLMEWTAKEKPLECRAAAVRALGSLMSRDKLNKEQSKEVLEIVGKAIEAKPSAMRRAAMSACDELGPKAKSLLSKVEAAVEKSPRRFRRFARETLAKMRKEQKPDDQISDLRDKLAKLAEENKKMKEQIEKLTAEATRGEEKGSEKKEKRAEKAHSSD